MFCENCGARLDDNAQFCGECGAKVGAQVENETQNVAYVQPVQPQPEQYYNSYSVPGKPEKKRSIVPIIIAIICGLLAIALVSTTIIFWDYIPAIFGIEQDTRDRDDKKDDKSKDEGNSAKKKTDKNDKGEAYVELYIDSYPSEVETDIVTVSGTIFTSKYRAELEVDGTSIETVTKSEGEIDWSVDLYLDEGKNTFKFTLVDSDGNSDTEKVVITYDYSWPFPVGTELTRTHDYPTSRIFVRPGPSKDSGEPIMAIYPEDYVTTLIYTGKYEEDYDAANGFHNWYEVTLPNGQVGWIRDDMAERKN